MLSSALNNCRLLLKKFTEITQMLNICLPLHVIHFQKRKPVRQVSEDCGHLQYFQQTTFVEMR